MTKDEEHVEHVRAQMQDGIDRVVQKMPSTLTEMFEAAELGPTEIRRLFEPDLELIGSFQLKLPLRALALLSAETLERMSKHWVYRAKADRETVVVLSFERREDLLRLGYVDIIAWVQDKQAKS